MYVIEAHKDSVLKTMAIEQGLCAQVDTIRRKDLNNKKEDQKYITSRGSLQDQSAGLILIMSC